MPRLTRPPCLRKMSAFPARASQREITQPGRTKGTAIRRLTRGGRRGASDGSAQRPRWTIPRAIPWLRFKQSTQATVKGQD